MVNNCWEDLTLSVAEIQILQVALSNINNSSVKLLSEWKQKAIKFQKWEKKVWLGE